MLKLGRMAPAAKDNRALLVLSTVGWFFPLPSLGYTVGNVARLAYHLALVASRVPLVVMHGDVQSDSMLATIPGGLRGVELAGLWPRCDVLALPRHDGRSDSPAR
jgi:hypothetical protein